MAFHIPREIFLGAAALAIQLIYSQIYPVLFEGGADHVADSSGSVDSPEVRVNLIPKPGPTLQESAASKPEQPESEAHIPEPKQENGADDSDQEKSYHFAGSTAVRARPRKNAPKFKLGDIVRDKVLLVRGVVVGWDASCQAPPWWKKSRLASASWGDLPHYLLLVDMRDVENLASEGQVNLTVYSPQATLEKLGKDSNPIVSPMLPHYFSLFEMRDGKYVPQPHIARLYPDDVHRHYQTDHDKLPEVDTHGQPLLRVVEFGRLIAHGRPVPVVRKGMFLVATEDLHDEHMFGKTAVLLLEHDDNSGTLGVIVNKNLSVAIRQKMEVGAEHIIRQMESMLRQQEQAAKSPMALQEFSEGIERASALLKLLRAPLCDVRVGGPVGLQEFPAGPHHFLLHPFKDIRGSKIGLRGAGTKADPDLFLSRPHEMNPKDIKNLVKRASVLTPEERAAGQRVILFAGNSAWGSKQLAGEIRGGLHNGKPSWAWLPATPRDVLKLADGVDVSFWKGLLNSSALQRLEDE